MESKQKTSSLNLNLSLHKQLNIFLWGYEIFLIGYKKRFSCCRFWLVCVGLFVVHRPATGTFNSIRYTQFLFHLTLWHGSAATMIKKNQQTWARGCQIQGRGANRILSFIIMIICTSHFIYPSLFFISAFFVCVPLCIRIHMKKCKTRISYMRI